MLAIRVKDLLTLPLAHVTQITQTTDLDFVNASTTTEEPNLICSRLGLWMHLSTRCSWVSNPCDARVYRTNLYKYTSVTK